jgi:hypothetical protein
MGFKRDNRAQKGGGFNVLALEPLTISGAPLPMQPIAKLFKRLNATAPAL